MAKLFVVARYAALAIAFVGLAAGAPAPNDFLQQRIVAEATIGSSGPQSGSGQNTASLDGYAPAPLPDVDHDAPIGLPADPSAPRLAPKLFHKQSQTPGEGYVFGSTAQQQLDRKAGPTPGINLVMPLE